MNMPRYVVQGKIHYGNNVVFIETGTDGKNNITGTYLEELLKNNIQENTDITIVIDVDK